MAEPVSDTANSLKMYLVNAVPDEESETESCNWGTPPQEPVA